MFTGRVILRFRPLIAPVIAAVVMLAMFAVLLGPAADRPTEAGVPPDIATVAVDLDPTGNTATHIGAGGDGIDAGDIQSIVTAAVGSTVTFDVVVDSVPSPGIFGIGFEVRYDPALVEVTAASITKQDDLLQFSGGGSADLRSHDVTPDTDGSFRVDSVDIGGIDETGPGRVLDVTVKCIAIGATAITLTDAITGGGVNAGILNTTTAFTIGSELEASIECGDTDEDGVLDVSDNCPYWYNPAQVLPPWPIATDDPDCDGFSTTTETFVGTDPFGQCAADDAANNEPLPDKWPTDADDNQQTNVFDVVPYIPALNSVAPGPPYFARLDLDASGDISVFDLVPFISRLNKVCTP